MVNVAASVKCLLLIVLGAIVFWLAIQAVSPVYANDGIPHEQPNLLIKFESTTTEAERSHFIRQIGGELARWIAPLHTAEIRIVRNGGQRSLDETVSAAHASSIVTWVEPDGYVSGAQLAVEAWQADAKSIQSTIPAYPIQINDPAFNDPHLVYAPQLIDVMLAWRYSMGTPDVIIAVVDSGVNAHHPDLQGRVLAGYDFINDDSDPADDHGHGTHIAGIIAANANNGVGSAGICPNCSILPVKVLNANNTGTWSAVAAGIVYAVDQGARVINLSLGGTVSQKILQDAVNYAVQNDVLIVAAAGNSRTDTPFYPAALDAVLAVSATRQDDTRWNLSNYGDWIDISAPGFAIYSLYHDLGNHYGGYTFMSGTSMASPHVAGVAGLLLSQQPGRTPADLRRLLLGTARDLGEPGRDIYFGFGRVDANKALELEAPKPKAIAVLAGRVWEDHNANGLWDQDENVGAVGSTGMSAITIHVQTLHGEPVRNSAVNGSGEWRVEYLYAGTYRVSAELSDSIVLTTQSEYIVELAEGQSIEDLNFGMASTDVLELEYRLFLPGILTD